MAIKPPIRVALLTVSDRASQGIYPDQSGPALTQLLADTIQAEVAFYAVVPDEYTSIHTRLLDWSDNAKVDLILTSGGTGFAPRDITPEVTAALVQKPAPGLTETMRAKALQITPHAMLSRAVAGIRGQTLIINLPGSPKGAVENLEFIIPVLPHAIELIRNSKAAEIEHHHHNDLR